MTGKRRKYSELQANTEIAEIVYMGRQFTKLLGVLVKPLVISVFFIISWSLQASDFCDLLEVEGRKFVRSDRALACNVDSDCSYVSSDLLNCGCGGLLIGKGLKTYEALEKVHEDICGISCIPECILTAHRNNGKIMVNKPFCVENFCVEKLVEVE